MEEFMLFMKTILALTFVCGLAYFIFRVVLPRFNFNFKSNNMVRIVDRITVDGRKSLCVIEVAGKWMLISVTETGVEQICELDADSAKIAELEIIKAKEEQNLNAFGINFTEKLTKLMKKDQGGK